MAIKKPKRRIVPLFFRILGAISMPLILLLIAFTSLIVWRELGIQKNNSIRSAEEALKTLNEEFKEILSVPEVLDSPELVREQTARLKDTLKVEKMDIIDPIEQTSLSDSKLFASEQEISNIRESISMKRQQKPYYVVVDEAHQKFHGYLPLRDKTRDRILVATIEGSVSSLKKAFVATLTTLIIMALITLAAAYLIAFFLSLRIVRPIRAINRACREILEGKLGLQVKVNTGDEIEVMASKFNKMSQALLVMTRQAEDSNPLTQLPGNREITSELMKRLEDHEKFIYFHVDLDHFKAYNDHYGLDRGDNVLRRTGEILAEVLKDFEGTDYFLGHQGGDDFILIVEPAQAKEIAARICKKFDEALKEFYDKEDFERGYFLGEDERSLSLSEKVEIKRHPLMSLSLAGVSNLNTDFLSYHDVLSRAIPIKKRAKKIPYSKFLIDE